MGVFKMFQDDSPAPRLSGSIFSKWKDKGSKSVVRESATEPNPRADNYSILRYRRIGPNLVVEIKYLDCTNYEGRKILLFENLRMGDLLEQKVIDPHFSDNKNFHSPIARFEPTIRGWNMACLIADKV